MGHARLPAPAVPSEEWDVEVLEAHVRSVMLEGTERVEMDCAACQHAAQAGLWDPWVDPGVEWLVELSQRVPALCSDSVGAAGGASAPAPRAGHDDDRRP